MAVFFGTDGLRGVVGNDLNYDIAFKCGNSLSQLISCGGKVVIGRDTRVTGSYLVSAISSGLTAGGAHVVDIGIAPTACIAYLTKSKGFDYGIVITASHNPKEYNGIKIFSPRGEKLLDKEEEAIERGFIHPLQVPALKVGQYRQDKTYVKDYINFLFNSASCCLSGYKIAIDASNGASFDIAPKLFKKLGAKVIRFSCKNDGNKINDNCGALHPQHLAEKVVKLGCDMGFAFDGDADRLIAVNEKGEIVDGDMVITALAKTFKSHGELAFHGVVGTSQTNMGIENHLAEHGIKLYRADVGDKYVAEIMDKNNLSLGGEQSGHVIIKKFLPTGDGILTAVALACACKESKKPLSEFCHVDLYPQAHINIEVVDKLRILNSEKLMSAITDSQQELAGLGRVLVRASGTEPKIRIMVESEKLETAECLAKFLASVVVELET